MTDLLATPNLGTGALEHRDRIDFGALRAARLARVLDAMAERDLDACFLGREANARYATGVRRLWTAQSRPFVPACLVVRNPPAVELLSFSASYEDIPDEVGPDHFFPVTWNPMNMMDRFQKTRRRARRPPHRVRQPLAVLRGHAAPDPARSRVRRRRGHDARAASG